MIKKTLICFSLLFVLYYVFRVCLRPDIIIGQEQWQGNQIKAQSYLYSDSFQSQIVIVGSSMSHRLEADSLSSCLNLAFGGESAYQGMELILRKGFYPKWLLVEMNTLMKTGRSDFSDVLFNPVLLNVRKHAPVMRDGRQPLPLMAAILEGYLPSVVPSELFMADSSMVYIPNRKIESLQREQFTTSDSLKIEEMILELKDILLPFEEHGTRIVFFEMPVSPSVCASNYNIRFREFLERSFDKPPFLFVPKHNCGDYETTDGVHLDSENAEKYTLYLKRELGMLDIN